MNRKQFAVMAAVMMIAGFAGGLLSERMFPHPTARAATTAPGVERGVALEFVSAKEFRLVDPSGKALAVLAVHDGNRPALEFFNQDGTLRMMVGLNKKEGPTIQFMGKAGKVRAALMMDEREGQPRLYLADVNHTPRIALDLLPDGTPQISLFDRRGFGRAQLGLTDRQDPYLALHDQGQAPRATLSLRPDGTPALEFFDRGGRSIWKTQPK